MTAYLVGRENPETGKLLEIAEIYIDFEQAQVRALNLGQAAAGWNVYEYKLVSPPDASITYH